MKKIILWTLIFISWTHLTHAAELPKYCESEAVRKIQRPLHAKDLAGPSFEYRFSLSEREDPNAPILIFFPGGPGQTSMNQALPHPYDFAVVRTDPRGVGCNDNDLLKSEHLTSYEMAQDVVAIIKELKPKRYFLHGISYGTIPATMVAAMVASEGLPSPEAVILEGSIGRAYAPNEYADDVLKEWKHIKTLLPPKVQQTLARGVPFNVSSKEWAAWLSMNLAFGLTIDGHLQAVEEISRLDGSAEEKAILKQRIQLMSRPPAKNYTRLFQTIACHEFVPDIRDVKYDYDWVKGDLVLTNDRLCKGIPFDTPYDAANFQIPGKVYYFSGTLDPVTPPAQARHHFDTQTSPGKYLVTVDGGGHAALSNNLMDCTDGVWRGILAGEKAAVTAAFGSCKHAARISVREK